MIEMATFNDSLIAVGAGLTVTFALIAGGMLARAPRHVVRDRLESLHGASPYVESGPVEVLRGRQTSYVPGLDLLLRSRRSTEEMRLALEQAGLDLRIGEYLALRLLAIALAVSLSGLVVSRLDVGDARVLLIAAGALAGLVLPTALLRRRITKRRAAIERELVEMCDLMASMLQSGFGYLQALNTAAEQMEEPLAGELARMRDAIRLGAGVDEAIEQMNERLQSRDFDMVATAIIIQRRSGGSLAEVLAGVAKTIRDRNLFRAEIAALTSRERYSAMVLAGFPLLLVGLLTIMLPETFGRLFTDHVGRIIFGIALTSDLVGYVLIKRVTRLEV